MAREYTSEFKLEAVKLANKQRKVGQPVAKVARDLGIRDSVLGKWMKRKKSVANAFPGKGHYSLLLVSGQFLEMHVMHLYP
ncbi:MAG: transposase [Wolbachia sp.]